MTVFFNNILTLIKKNKNLNTKSAVFFSSALTFLKTEFEFNEILIFFQIMT